ncbi:MAG TPA: hypothetical protein ENK02_04485 [Planctomycetes bacterium]|nr:hypothetical protein [Planctomycetota bacterium]
MTRTRILTFPALFLLLPLGPFLGSSKAAAVPVSSSYLQGSQGPSETKDLLKKIQKEMARIDELLNRAASKSRKTSSSSSSFSKSSTGKTSSTQKTSGSKAEVKKLLKESAASNGKVIQLIDQLLAKAQRESSSSSSSPMKPPKNSGKPSGKQKPKPDNRENNSPDLQKQQKAGNSKNPKDPKGSKEKAKLLKGNKKPPSGKTGESNNSKGSGRWGFLPPYLQFLFRKGGAPKVPGKYEKWAEEFNRSVDRKKK